jgi:signal transduction histidine kinase
VKFVSNLPPEDRRLFTKLLYRSVVFPFWAIIVMGGIVVGLSFQQSALSDWVDHSDRLIGETARTEKLIIDAETGVRGFALTQDARFLGPWEKSKPEIAHQWDVLSELLTQDPTQAASIAHIKNKFEEWAKFATQLVHQMGARKEQPDYFDHAEGRVRMDSIRTDFDEFLAKVRQLRDERVARSGVLRTVVRIATVLLMLFSGIFISIFTRRQLIQVAQTYEKALREVSLREEEFKKIASNLERSNRELEQFAAIASHDLKEPLRMVKLYVQFLKEKYYGKFDKRADDSIGYIVEGTDRMRNLIDSILLYSQVSQGGLPLVPVNTSEALDKALTNLKASLEETGAVITKDCLPMVQGEPIQLCQIFQNLIANALKFRKGTPEISITSTKEGKVVRFAVADNGIGMEPEMHERIFGLFQRLHKRQQYAGTGIGLAICKRIIEQHGGIIWVESKLNEGSTFYFTLIAT